MSVTLVLKGVTVVMKSFWMLLLPKESGYYVQKSRCSVFDPTVVVLPPRSKLKDSDLAQDLMTNLFLIL